MSESEKEEQNVFKNQLLSAIGEENVDEIIELIDNGAKVHEMFEDNWSPLHLAIAWGKFKSAKFLIEFGLDIHSYNPVGQSTLTLAISENQVDNNRNSLAKRCRS